MKTILLTVAAGLTLIAQTPAPKPVAKAPATKTTATAPAAKKPAAAPAPNRALLNPALLKAKAPDVYKARFTTTKGDFVVEVHRDWAPLGADRFYNLVKNGFFDNSHFFRVITGFMVQFGLSPSPAINKVWESAKLADDPVKNTNKKGNISFATAGPNTRTTQVFINYGDNARLDGMGFSPFGTVIEGMDVVEKLYSGYGEGAPGGAGPAQDRIQSEGKAYLDKGFPLLDSIKIAKIDGPPAPPAKKALAPAAKTGAPAAKTAAPAAKTTPPVKK